MRLFGLWCQGKNRCDGDIFIGNQFRLPDFYSFFYRLVAIANKGGWQQLTTQKQEGNTNAFRVKGKYRAKFDPIVIIAVKENGEVRLVSEVPNSSWKGNVYV